MYFLPLLGCDFFDSKTNMQICKYTKEHLGTFFSDGDFCNFFVIFWHPMAPNGTQIRKYANVSPPPLCDFVGARIQKYANVPIGYTGIC